MPYKNKEDRDSHQKEYYIKNKEKINENNKKYYKENIETEKERRKQYYINNIDDIKERTKKWEGENKEHLKEYRKQYNLKNRDKVLERQKKWYAKNREKQIGKNKKYYIDHPEYIEQYRSTAKGRYTAYKARAKNRGFIFNLTLNEFSEIINKPCYYCGGEGYGIDRLESSIGYLEGNIVSCCSMCNWMKNNYSEQDFINQCIKIANNKERG